MCYFALYSILVTILTYNYSINNMLLESVNQHKYLGAMFHTTSMSLTKHIQEVINKASKTLNFVKHTLYQCDPSVKVTTYNT